MKYLYQNEVISRETLVAFIREATYSTYHAANLVCVQDLQKIAIDVMLSLAAAKHRSIAIASAGERF